MTLDDLIPPLCGLFKPADSDSGNWLQEFVGANVLGLGNLILPGENVQCLIHDTLMKDPDSGQDYILDYVAVQKGVARFGFEKLNGKADEHFFITRPFVARYVTEKSGVSHDVLSVESLVSLWSHIGRTFRWALQRKYGKELTPVPFSVLTSHGVPLDTVWHMQAVCISVCQRDNLGPDARLAYMDRSAIEVLVSHTVITDACAKGLNSSPIGLENIAQAILLHAPKVH